MSSTLLASCWGPSSLFTVSWKSEPNSLAIVRRSADRSERNEGALETEQEMLPESVIISVEIDVYKVCVFVCVTGDDDLRGPHRFGHEQTDQPNRSCGERGNEQYAYSRGCVKHLTTLKEREEVWTGKFNPVF